MASVAEKRKSPDLDGEYAEESEKRSKINGTRRLRKSPRNLRKLASTGEPETIELSSGSEADTPMRFSQEDEVLEEDAELPPGEVSWSFCRAKSFIKSYNFLSHPVVLPAAIRSYANCNRTLCSNKWLQSNIQPGRSPADTRIQADSYFSDFKKSQSTTDTHTSDTF